MNFTSPVKVLETIRAGDEIERARGDNRRRINALINGTPPLSDAEAKRLNVKINVNWGEGPVLAAHARRQYDNAILGTEHYFKVTLPLAPEDKQTDWGSFITRAINRPIKQSDAYTCLKESQFASVVAHGIGPQMWYDSESWLPESVAVEDLRVATDTEVSFRNLDWFAVRHYYTPGELSAKVFGPNADSGWDRKTVARLLADLREVNYGETNYTWDNSPEKMAELVKQNAGYYSSDAMPTIPLWHFHHRDEDNKKKRAWFLCVVPENNVPGLADQEVFLYQSNKPVARDVSELLHVQFGDLNNKAPFLYHSVRSLGYLLMEPCFWTNLTRCRLLQHAHESFNIWLRASDPSGRSRAQKVELFDKCFIPEGVSIVPQQERHQIDAQLLAGVMSQLKQLQAEASQSYTQETDTGTSKEQTATEVMAKVNSVNAMMAGLLGRAFRKETHSYREICRRFCLSKTSDPDAQRFQKLCRDEGIPRVWLNPELWDIQPETPMGAGNPTMAMAQAQQLLQMRPLYDPAAQQEILHDVTVAVTGDSRKAARWTPLDKQTRVSDAAKAAESDFAVLMLGVPTQFQPGLNPIEQTNTLLGLTAGVIVRIAKTGGVPTPAELAGLQTVAQHTAQLIAQFAQNPAEKQRATQSSQVLSKLMAQVQKFADALAQQQQAAQQSPEAAAKAQAHILQAQVKAQTSTATATQKLQHKDAAFRADQQRKNIQTQTDIARKSAQTQADIQAQGMKTLADIQNASLKAGSTPD